jgi:hypothetical protein
MGDAALPRDTHNPTIREEIYTFSTAFCHYTFYNHDGDGGDHSIRPICGFLYIGPSDMHQAG